MHLGDICLVDTGSIQESSGTMLKHDWNARAACHVMWKEGGFGPHDRHAHPLSKTSSWLCFSKFSNVRAEIGSISCERAIERM